MSATKKLTQLALVAGILSSLASCTNEDLMYNPQLEAYTRAFIKEFGKIDPQQDWNMAQDANVVIDLGNRIAQSVKVYARYENTYYIVANLVDLTGQFTVPIDIPQSSNEILVNVDGDAYYGTISAPIDCTGASSDLPRSRALLDENEDVKRGTEDKDGDGVYDPLIEANGGTKTVVTHNNGNYTVEVSMNDWDYFNAQQIAPITSTENWPRYYSTTGEGAWRENDIEFNIDNLRLGRGIVPENGTANAPYGYWPNADGGSTTGTFHHNFILHVTDGYFDLYPYYSGSNKKHDLYVYFVKSNGVAAELDSEGKPILYPIYEDTHGDDIQMAIRPLKDVNDILGVAVYAHNNSDDLVDANNIKYPKDSYGRIGDKLGEIYYDGSSATWENGAANTSKSFRLVSGTMYWIFPIIQTKDSNGNLGRVSLERLQETTSLPRYEQNKHLNISKRGLAKIKDDKEIRLTISVRNFNGSLLDKTVTVNGTSKTISGIYNNDGDFDGGVTKTVLININNDWSKDTSSGTTTSDKYVSIEAAIPLCIYDPNKFYTYWNNSADSGFSFYRDTELQEEFIQAIIDAFDAGTLDLSKKYTHDKGEEDLNPYYNNLSGLPSPNDYEIVGYTMQWGDNQWWFKLTLYFQEKSSSQNNSPQRSYSQSRADDNSGEGIYDTKYIEAVLNPDNYTDDNFVRINTDYNPLRPVGEECSSFVTDIPLLCRTHGYHVVLKNKDKTNYTGYIGIALKNTYVKNPDTESGGRNFLDTSNIWHEFYTYSQARYNEYTYDDISKWGYKDDLTYQYSYAGYFEHPKSGRTFFSFEDWEITKPSGDISLTNSRAAGEAANYEYTPYAWGKGTGDYSSDRDYNDMIFRFTPATFTADPEPVIETEITEEGFSWLWALEDLGSTDDFDFNDVVMRITSITTNVDDDGTVTTETFKKVRFTPLAAGGTLPIYIHYVDKDGNDYVLSTGKYNLTLEADINLLKNKNGEEYHEWFTHGSDYPTIPSSQMINTGNGISLDIPIDVDNMSCTLTLSTTFTIAWHSGSLTDANPVGDANNQNTFYVTVNGETADTSYEKIDVNMAYRIGTPLRGGAPQSFIIMETSDNPWKWPQERIHISRPYPEFADWAAQKDGHTGWYKEPKDEPVYSRKFK